MSDILKVLRTPGPKYRFVDSDVLTKAADEIERLRVLFAPAVPGEPVLFVSAEQLPMLPEHGYFPARRKPEGKFQTPLYLHPAQIEVEELRANVIEECAQIADEHALQCSSKINKKRSDHDLAVFESAASEAMSIAASIRLHRGRDAMSDLIERLRDADIHSQQRVLGSRIFGEAADRIEALERKNAAMREALRDMEAYCAPYAEDFEEDHPVTIAFSKARAALRDAGGGE